jgi:hypothetical protein
MWRRIEISVLALLATGLFLILILILQNSAAAHSWYDGACCNENDCRQTTFGEVERTEGGWLFVPTGELIPFDDKRIKHSLDPLIHVCLRGRNMNGVQTVRCLYIPDIAG